MFVMLSCLFIAAMWSPAGNLLVLLYVMILCVFVAFPCGALGQVWYLIVMIPDSSTNLDDRYSNLFLNVYINCHAHTEYLKMIKFYSSLGIWHVFLYSYNTNIYHFRSMKYRQYA